MPPSHIGMVADDRPARTGPFTSYARSAASTWISARESGDKLTRFGPFSSQCRAGNIKILRGAWNEELFRVLEGFPDLAHDDEVDACSGALEMLNPPMSSWAAYEIARQDAEAIRAKQHAKPQGARPDPARGSMEWFTRQQELKNSS